MAKHVDDLKITAPPHIIKWLLNVLQEVFGAMRIWWFVFTNCGIRHIQDQKTFAITTDQIECANTLKLVPYQGHKGEDNDQELSSYWLEQYRSLLGAAMFTTLTRFDVLVFVAALARVAHKACVIHLKRLNKLVKWMQLNPRRFVFDSRPLSNVILAISDSAFKKEEETGHAMKGALFLRPFAPSDGRLRAVAGSSVEGPGN